MLNMNKKLIARVTAVAFLGSFLAPSVAFAQGSVTCIVMDTKSIGANDLFDFDKSTLTASGKTVLDNYAANLRSMKSISSISLVGHTDGKGTADYNYALGQRRADAVKAYLSTKNIDAKIIQASSKGKTQLLNNELTADGKDDPIKRQANRRVEVIVSGETIVAGSSCPTTTTAAAPTGAAGSKTAVAESTGGLSTEAIVGGIIVVGGIIAVAVSGGGDSSSGTTGTTGTTGTR